jgi:sulfoxide reductase heme-binding subunit YedZ
VSHGVHAIAVISFAQLDPKQFHEMIGITTYLIAGPTYAFIIAMTATSFDRTASWIGPRAWRVLHTAGAYYIWLNFMYVEGKHAIYSSFYRPFAAFVVFILVVRFVRVPAGAQASLAK